MDVLFSQIQIVLMQHIVKSEKHPVFWYDVTITNVPYTVNLSVKHTP